MALTLKWWTDLKSNNKVDGKSAPDTEFEKKLKSYDDLRESIDSTVAMKKALVALAEVEKARATSMTVLTKAGFAKLATECSPNGGRLLNLKISDEKKLLQAKSKEIAAKMELGPAQLQGLGPGGGNIRQKRFDGLQKIIIKLHADVKKLATLDKEQITGCVNLLEGLEKDVGLYCKESPDAKSFQSDYENALAGFKRVLAKWGTPKALEALKTVGPYLTRMATAEYVK